MKSKTAAIHQTGTDEARFSELIRDSVKELSAIHKANKLLDAEIRRLQTSTRKKLDRIQENLRHVQATR